MNSFVVNKIFSLSTDWFLLLAFDDNLLLVSDPEEDPESGGQQGRAQQVADSREVRDGRVVGIDLSLPHEQDEGSCQEQQDQDLDHGSSQVDDEEGRCDRCMTRPLNESDPEREDQVSRDRDEEQDTGRLCVHMLATKSTKRRGTQILLITGQDAGHTPLMQVRGDSGRLHCHQVATHAVNDRLEDGDARES